MKLNFRIEHLPPAVVAGAAACALLLTACGGPSGATSGADLDLAPLKIDSSQAQQMQALYDAAIESGETDVAIYAGHHDEFKEIYAAFEERFPGLTITPETYVGAELQTKLEAERQSGKRVVDVLSNPNADRYADQGFAQKFKPVAFSMPEWAAGRISLDQIEDPDGFYYAPWALMFASSYNTEKLQESDLPASWADLAGGEWAGKLTFMDPSIPGGTMTVSTTLLQAGIVDEAWLKSVGANAKVVAQDQLALQSISSGEFAYQPLSATISVLNAKRDGAPVEVQFFDENNVIATEKWMLADGAPSTDAAKLLLSFLYTAEAQEKTLEAGNFPINQDESLTSPHGWPSLADAAFVELPEQSVMREKMTEYGELFKSITAK